MFPPASPVGGNGNGAPPAGLLAQSMLAKQGPALIDKGVGPVNLQNDGDLLKYFNAFKDEAFDQRWIYERTWLRNLYYIMGRQWIFYDIRAGWRDMRLARGTPRPTTSQPKEIIQSIRAMFTAIQIGVNVRPNGRDPKAVITAATADDLGPILHDLHEMNANLTEFDFWFASCGNALFHSFWDTSAVHGLAEIPWETCVECGLDLRADAIADAHNVCPSCKGNAFIPALDEYQEPRVDHVPKGAAVTVPLSPLEVAFPLSKPRWSAVPGLIRMSWMDKREFEHDPELQPYIKRLAFQKAPADRSLQIFRSLPFHSDLGMAPRAWDIGSGSTVGEGIPCYELWAKPSPLYPDGLVIRVLGDTSPVILRKESESLPGPIPYHDAKGNPLFTFTHAAYEHVGGRVLGSGALDPIIGKVDQLNRTDAMLEMQLARTANPFWTVAKNAEVAGLDQMGSTVGAIVTFNPLAAGGGEAARPRREPGLPIDDSVIAYREHLIEAIERGAGTSDLLKGFKPAGVSAFSAMQLLVESGQRRFAGAFQARGMAYTDWFKFALELEREFGPNDRTYAVMTPNRGWAFKNYDNANLGGDVSIIIENGTQQPKTQLGKRAAIDHAHQMGILMFQDKDQIRAGLDALGLTDMIPSLDANIEAALNRQQAFEDWLRADGPAHLRSTPNLQTGAIEPDMTDPAYPLRWKRWYDPETSRTECLKWANSDTVTELLKEFPAAEGLITAYLMEIDITLSEKAAGMLDPGGLADQTSPTAGGAPLTARPPGTGPGAPLAPPQPPQPGGAGRAMQNSNQNSGALHSLPGGPAMNPGNGQAPL